MSKKDNKTSNLDTRIVDVYGINTGKPIKLHVMRAESAATLKRIGRKGQNQSDYMVQYRLF